MMKSALKVVNGVEVDSGTKVNTLVENQSQSLSDRNLEVGETIKLNLEECIKVFPNHCEKMQPETNLKSYTKRDSGFHTIEKNQVINEEKSKVVMSNFHQSMETIQPLTKEKNSVTKKEPNQNLVLKETESLHKYVNQPVNLKKHDGSISEVFRNDREKLSKSQETPVDSRSIINKQKIEDSINLTNDSLKLQELSKENVIGINESTNISKLTLDVKAKNVSKKLFDSYDKKIADQYLFHNDKFSIMVTEYFMNLFNFHNKTVDVALREYFSKVDLVGETHDKDLQLEKFSKRYCECNETTYNNDSGKVHFLVWAIVLLNTDLHSLGLNSSISSNLNNYSSLGRNSSFTRFNSKRGRMSMRDFIKNTSSEKYHFDEGHLKDLYKIIRKNPLMKASSTFQLNSKRTSIFPSISLFQSASKHLENENLFENSSNFRRSQSERQHSSQSASVDPIRVNSNKFLRNTNKNHYAVWRQNILMKKDVRNRDGTKPKDKYRKWQACQITLDKLDIKFVKNAEKVTSRYQIHHCLASIHKNREFTTRQLCLKVELATQQVFLLKATSERERNAWVNSINLNAALLSSEPLSAAVGSKQLKFQKPLLPSSPGTLNIDDQLESHKTQLGLMMTDLDQSKRYLQQSQLSNAQVEYNQDKITFLQFMITRYKLYIKVLNEVISKKNLKSLKFTGDQLSFNNNAPPKGPLASSLPTLLVKGVTFMDEQENGKKENRLVKSSHQINKNTCGSEKNMSPLVHYQNYNNNNVKRFSSRRLGTSRRSYMFAVNTSK